MTAPITEVDVKEFNGLPYRKVDSYVTRIAADTAAGMLRKQGHLAEVARRGGARSFIPGAKTFDVWVRYSTAGGG